MAVNIITHLERTGTIGVPDTPDDNAGAPTTKDISGMGNVLLGLMVLLLASVMVLSRDAFHGAVRLALSAFAGPHLDPDTLTWEATYGDLLRKIGKHPDGGSQLSAAAIGGVPKGGRSVRNDEGEEEVASLLGEEGGRDGKGALEMTPAGVRAA